MVKIVKKEVKQGGFASTSEFFRYLIRSWNTQKLARELKNDRKEFEAGKGKILKSFKKI